MAKNILLVEDDEPLAAALGTIVEQAGYRVTVVSHFEHALNVLESDAIDLLVTDIVMPKSINGLALSRMARMRRPTLPVVYMTAYDISGVDRQVLGEVLRKPVDREMLLDAIERAVQPTEPS